MTQLGLQSIEGAELEKEWKTGATVCEFVDVFNSLLTSTDLSRRHYPRLSQHVPYLRPPRPNSSQQRP
jgi:hypothetical protein